MEHSKRLPITNRIFSKSDLQTIANLFDQIREEWIEQDQQVYSEFEIVFSDDTSIKTPDGKAAFLENVDRKRPVRVEAYLSNTDTGSRFSVYLAQHKWDALYYLHPQCFANISSADENWVQSTHAKIAEIVNDSKKQARWPSFVVFLVLLIVLGLSFSITVPISEGFSALRIFGSIIGYLFAFILSFSFPFLGMLWPPVELDIGPEHHKVEKRRRAALALFGTSIVIPLVINLIT